MWLLYLISSFSYICFHLKSQDSGVLCETFCAFLLNPQLRGVTVLAIIRQTPFGLTASVLALIFSS